MRQLSVLAALLVGITLPVSAAGGQTPVIRLPATKDNSIVLVEGETEQNAGRQERLRIKGNQHLLALDFDFARLRGRRVRSAKLVCHQVDHAIDGLTISTIQAPWDEYRSNALSGGIGPEQGWGWTGARFPAVTGGNSFSRVCQAPSRLADGVYTWDIDPDLVHANAVGTAYGLTLHEWTCDYSRNPRVFSREDPQHGPVLIVEMDPAAAPLAPPEPPAGLHTSDTGDAGSLRLHLTAPEYGFAYEVRVNDLPLGRWNIPFVQPGYRQTVFVRDLNIVPGHPVSLQVRTLDRLGRVSPWAVCTATWPGGREDVQPPRVDPPPARPPDLEGLAVIPVMDKYDIQGRPIGDLPADYRVNNPVFDGRTIRLEAARGEVVSFQALLRGRGRAEVQCRVDPFRVDLFKGLYVEAGPRRIVDPLVPLEEVSLATDHDTVIVADVYVPFDARAGTLAGELAVSDGRRVPIVLHVLDTVIGREACFACEMNTYGMPDAVETFYALQRVAYDHRCHVNILHYSHRTAAPGARKCNLDMRMADGRRMDERRYNAIQPGATEGYWDDFVQAFGPYLSGACFSEGHRGAVPAPGFYLTFHESWPLNVRTYFNGDPDAYKAFREYPEYAATFVAILKDFIAAARQQGWTRTGFQLYLNNKGSLDDPSRSPWILDEPASYWDYRALAFYADLTQQAKGRECPVTIDYRIDISRPQFDRGELAGKADLWVVSTDAMRAYPRLITDRTERTGERVWVYGTTNDVEQSNRQTLAWTVWAYRHGAQGVVPWQTVNRNATALRQADALGLFIFDRDADGRPTIRHSLRLKAYRQAEQLIERLEHLREKQGLSDGQIGRIIDRFFDGGGTVRRQNEADAGTAHYDRLDPWAFWRLNQALGRLLEP